MVALRRTHVGALGAQSMSCNKSSAELHSKANRVALHGCTDMMTGWFDSESYEGLIERSVLDCMIA